MEGGSEVFQNKTLGATITKKVRLVYGKPKRTILSNTIFSWSKLIFAWANSLLHGQMYYYMGKSIIARSNLLFHGQIYYSMGIFIILCAICYFHGQIVVIACVYFHAQNFAQAHHGYVYASVNVQPVLHLLGASLSGSCISDYDKAVRSRQERCGRCDAGTNTAL